MLAGIFSSIISYVLGSIPFGLILGKGIWRTDLRHHGSGNIGATNAWRILGKKAGITIFLCDFLKGLVAVGIAQHLSDSAIVAVLAAIFALVGHSFSFLMQFKGGKGVATGLGVLVMLMPTVSLIAFVLWSIIVYVTRYVSLGSCVAALAVAILGIAMDYPLPYAIFGVLAAILIVVRHRSNIGRLLNGTENKI